MGRSMLSIPGTITVSARFSNDSRQGTWSVTCADLICGCWLHVRTS
jgi:hypothetical protein